MDSASFIFKKIEGIDPFDTGELVKVPVCGNDFSQAMVVHDGGMDEIPCLDTSRTKLSKVRLACQFLKTKTPLP